MKSNYAMKSQNAAKAKKEPRRERVILPRRDSRPETGLTAEQAAERLAAGYGNYAVDAPTKTIGQIIKTNVLTYFNLVFTILAVCIIAVGSLRDLVFMPVVIVNTLIGIIQEIRSKKTLDKLTLLSEPRADVLRDGKVISVPSSELVLDDVVIFSAGKQICADADILEGEVQVNEALITGEPDEITKTAGDELLSGSFIISGSCKARLTRVGADSFASRLTLEAKKMKKRHRSEMMHSLTRLVQVIGLLIFPVGIALFYNQHFVQSLSIRQSVVTSVAALVGMIPEGLYLLTTVALAVSVIRLARKKTLVHELGCIETLARVNVLCVDKTGTITQPNMLVEDLVLLCEDRFNRSDVENIISDHVFNLGSDNETMKALARRFGNKSMRQAERVIPFSSMTKYSCAIYEEGETYIMGAPEVILGSEYEKYREIIEPYSMSGFRVLLLVMYDGPIEDGKLKGENAMPFALILLSNTIRENARETFSFFARQGVAIKVISGDNPMTVSHIAKKAGIEGADNYVDAMTLNTETKIKAAAKKYTIFGRVTPEQKRKLIRALRADGNIVAMTGDGVNDVLALKDADCSIAMASGSEVASQVSHLVLLDSDFSSMPSVVMEGRRVINNIQRSAALFLVKNIFSFTLAIITMLFPIPYPVTPAQLSMVSTLTIGIPSFFLALEPNTAIVKGRFLKNVLFRALPGGLTDVILVLTAMAFTYAFDLELSQLSTISAILLAVVGFMVLIRVCRPFTAIRKAVCVMVAVALVFSVIFLRDLFALQPIDIRGALVLAVLAALSYPLMEGIAKLQDSIAGFFTKRRNRKKILDGRFKP